MKKNMKHRLRTTRRPSGIAVWVGDLCEHIYLQVEEDLMSLMGAMETAPDGLYYENYRREYEDIIAAIPKCYHGMDDDCSKCPTRTVRVEDLEGSHEGNER